MKSALIRGLKWGLIIGVIAIVLLSLITLLVPKENYAAGLLGYLITLPILLPPQIFLSSFQINLYTNFTATTSLVLVTGIFWFLVGGVLGFAVDICKKFSPEFPLRVIISIVVGFFLGFIVYEILISYYQLTLIPAFIFIGPLLALAVPYMLENRKKV